MQMADLVISDGYYDAGYRSVISHSLALCLETICSYFIFHFLPLQTIAAYLCVLDKPLGKVVTHIRRFPEPQHFFAAE